MAVGTIADAVVNTPFAHTGIIEGVSQNIDLFNSLSNGTIVLRDPVNRGAYHADEIYFGTFEDFTTRHKVASGGSLSSDDVKNISDIQVRDVKMNKKIVVQQDEQFFRKGASGIQNIDEAAGVVRGAIEREFVRAALKSQLNDCVNAVQAAIRSQTALVNDVATGAASAGAGGLTHARLNTTLAKLGDQRGRIRALVMHSESYRQLVDQNVGAALTGVSDLVLREGTTATYGLPVLVTDAASLTGDLIGSAGTADEYIVLGLVENAIELTVTEAYTFDVTKMTGQEIPSYEMFGRWAHSLKAKGLSWKTASADNPTETALGTTTNWEKKATSEKMCAGVALIHN
ncbi:MAG: major capsid protein [Pseudomonadota bacterium]